MPIYIDQLGRSVELKKAPQRIVSAVPSLSELIVDLGAEQRLVGITSWCVHPTNLLLDKKVIGGTKNLDISKIRSLKPDLIIANKEENPQDQIEALAKEFPVWVSDVRSLDQAFDMIAMLAKLLELENRGANLLGELAELRKGCRASDGLSYLYFIWKDPYMVAGKDTYISSLFDEIGMQNLAPENEERYPQLSLQSIQELKPDRIILSSEPYSFKAVELKTFHELGMRSLLVSGELFTWYGSRIKACLKYLNNNPFNF
ncbi:MAG: helical backbone metal receptor [Bacteroidetes bacterium]|nr:helical backbone metal receptor [Bacteroidota bacterium]